MSLEAKSEMKALNQRFFSSYDTEYWITRARVLHLMIVRADVRRRVFEEIDRIDDDASIVDRLKADLHFLCHHSVESLFAVLFGRTIQPECPWIWLTSYTFHDFNKLLEDVATKGFPKGVLETLLFDRPSGDETVQFYVKLIDEYLRELARQFRDRTDYNSFKHGLRTTRIGRSWIKLAGISFGEELVSSYLELETVPYKGGTAKRIKLAAKTIDFEKSFRIIEFNTHLIRNLIRIPKALLEGSPTAELFHPDPETEVGEILRISVSAGKTTGFGKMTMSRPILVVPKKWNKKTK